MKPADLGRFDIEDSAKLVGTVALAFWTKDMLVKQGIIPPNTAQAYECWPGNHTDENNGGARNDDRRRRCERAGVHWRQLPVLNAR